MPGVDYDRMSRPEVVRALLGLAASSWPHDVPEYAIRGILALNGMLAAPMDDDTFAGAVTTLRGYLDVPMPDVPADLDTLDDAQLRTLTAAMELAYWDFHRRSNALGFTEQLWRRRVEHTTPQRPTLVTYRDTFLKLANAIRSRRGLPNLVA